MITNECIFSLQCFLITSSFHSFQHITIAIQSIGVCKQKLENDKNLSLGRIIFPAIILHGSYDFSIMIFNFVSTLSDSKNKENNDNNGDEQMGNDDIEANNSIQLIYSICAFVVSILWVTGGALYFWRESKRQKIRLEQLDSARNFVGV
jgi:hypothetical protein